MTHPAPWDRRPDEPEQAYVGFLFYRNLGPNRSLDRAYRRYLVECDLAPRATKRKIESAELPGNWGENSSKYEWGFRAREWDIWRLQTYGSRVAVLYTHNLERALEKHAESIDEYGVGDPEWKAVLNTFDSLGHHLEMVREVRKREKSSHDSGSDGAEVTDPGVRVGGDREPVESVAT